MFRHPFLLTLLDLILSCRLNFLIFFFLINPVSITCFRFIYFKLVGTSPLLPLLIPLLIPYASSSSGEFLDQLFLLLASFLLFSFLILHNVTFSQNIRSSSRHLCFDRLGRSSRFDTPRSASSRVN